MEEIRKITYGFVVQRWDTDGNFLGQAFVDLSEVEYEDEEGNPLDEGDFDFQTEHSFEMER